MANLVTESAEELIYLAESDIITIKELLAEVYYPADRKYNIICFHTTQAVEKILKGFLINNGKIPDRIHDLDVLLKTAIEIDNSFSEIIDYCLILNKLIPNIKYSSKKEITKQMINETISSLEAICNFLPLKEMRDAFSKKYNYEIVAELTVKKNIEDIAMITKDQFREKLCSKMYIICL